MHNSCERKIKIKNKRLLGFYFVNNNYIVHACFGTEYFGNEGYHHHEKGLAPSKKISFSTSFTH